MYADLNQFDELLAPAAAAVAAAEEEEERVRAAEVAVLQALVERLLAVHGLLDEEVVEGVDIRPADRGGVERQYALARGILLVEGREKEATGADRARGRYSGACLVLVTDPGPAPLAGAAGPVAAPAGAFVVGRYVGQWSAYQAEDSWWQRRWYGPYAARDVLAKFSLREIVEGVNEFLIRALARADEQLRELERRRALVDELKRQLAGIAPAS